MGHSTASLYKIFSLAFMRSMSARCRSLALSTAKDCPVGLPALFTLLLEALLGRPTTGLFLVVAVEVEEDTCGTATGTDSDSTTPLDTGGCCVCTSSSISGTSFKPDCINEKCTKMGVMKWKEKGGISHGTSMTKRLPETHLCKMELFDGQWLTCEYYDSRNPVESWDTGHMVAMNPGQLDLSTSEALLHLMRWSL